MSITIVRVGGDSDLHHKYPSEREPQPCHAWLDCRADTLSASYDAGIGTAVTQDVYYGHTQRWAIPALRAGAANKLLEELAPLAERIVAGYSRKPRRNGDCEADFDDDADAAIQEAAELCTRCFDDDVNRIVAWDAGEWYAALGDDDMQRRELGITRETTDEELAAIVEREVAAADEQDVDVLDGLEGYLKRLRERATSPDAEG